MAEKLENRKFNVSLLGAKNMLTIVLKWIKASRKKLNDL